MPYGSAEFFKFKLAEILASDAQLLGRTTYEGFAQAWAERHDEVGFADKFNDMPKYVVSTTLKETSWNNSHIIHDDFVKEIEALKKQEGKDILVSGSGQLVRYLFEQHLVDQLDLLVYPVVLGEGKRLFEDFSKTELTLITSETFPKGVMHLAFKPSTTAKE
jgi:dihydrofolate reductase